MEKTKPVCSSVHRYSDRIIAIDAGKGIYTGTPEEILANGTLKKIFHVDVQRSEYNFA